jgi:hypothetical protein
MVIIEMGTNKNNTMEIIHLRKSQRPKQFMRLSHTNNQYSIIILVLQGC